MSQKLLKDIDGLLFSIGGEWLLSKAINPLSNEDLQSIEIKVATILHGAASKVGDEELAAFISMVMESKSPEDLLANPKITKVVEKAFGTIALSMSSKDWKKVQKDLKNVYIRTKQLWSEKLKIVSSFTLQDEGAIEYLHENSQFWFKNTFLSKDKQALVVEKMRAIGEDAKASGLGRKELAQNIEDKLGHYFNPDYPYWNVQASSMLVRARTVSTLRSFSEAGCTTYRWIAMGDERTCPICGSLDGQEWSVSTALKHVEKEMSLKDPEDLKYSSPWVYPEMKNNEFTGKGLIYKKSTEKIQKANMEVVELESTSLSDIGVNCPPIHGNCRCVLVASKFSKAFPQEKMLVSQDNIYKHKGHTPRVF